jgi:hypothetical protein
VYCDDLRSSKLLGELLSGGSEIEREFPMTRRVLDAWDELSESELPVPSVVYDRLTAHVEEYVGRGWVWHWGLWNRLFPDQIMN